MKNATLHWTGKHWNVIVSEESPRTDGTVQIIFTLDEFMALPATRYVTELTLERAGLGLAALLPGRARAEAPDPE